MLERLESVKENFKELTDKLTNPEIIANQAEFQHLAKKRAEMESLVSAFGFITRRATSTFTVEAEFFRPPA